MDAPVRVASVLASFQVTVTDVVVVSLLTSKVTLSSSVTALLNLTKKVFAEVAAMLSTARVAELTKPAAAASAAVVAPEAM